MNEVVEEWLNKAEADFNTAKRESVVSHGANYDAVCFHAQQCICRAEAKGPLTNITSVAKST